MVIRWSTSLPFSVQWIRPNLLSLCMSICVFGLRRMQAGRCMTGRTSSCDLRLSRLHLCFSPKCTSLCFLLISFSFFLPALRRSAYFALWYGLNVGYNIYNKNVMNSFPYPFTVATAQLGLGLLYVLPVWALGLRKPPKVSSANIKALVPIALFHTIGHTLTVVSLGAGKLVSRSDRKRRYPFITRGISTDLLLVQFSFSPVLVLIE